MAAIDGSTLLNAANVQWKAGADDRSGNLTFNNSTVFLTASTLKLPFKALRSSQGPAKIFDQEIHTIVFPMILTMPNPATTFVNAIASNIYEIQDEGWSNAFGDQAFKSQRGAAIRVIPISSSIFDFNWEGQVWFVT
jgi:hypothetical protein